MRVLDGSNIEYYAGGWVSSMQCEVGKIHTISKVASTLCRPAYVLKGSFYTWDERGLAKADSQKIVITTDGNTTLARLYEDGKVTKTAKAKCSPDDEFDFAVGAKLAFERLNEKHESKEPFNGKAVCIEVDTPCAYTVGKIYEFKDGRTVIDNGCEFPCRFPITSIEEWNARYPHELIAKFLEIKE